MRKTRSSYVPQMRQPCQTPPNTFSFSTNAADLDSYDPVVYNIFFWQVNRPDGTTSVPVTENIVLEAVANLNQFYNQHKIFFKYKGFDEFDSPNDVWATQRNPITNDCEVIVDPFTGNPQIDPEGFGSLHVCQIPAFWGFVNANGYKETNSFNVYLPYSTVAFGGAASLGNTRSINKVTGLTGTGFIHEIGHNFGLFHTRSKGAGSEHVTRDPSDILNYNAHEAGDFVVDTAANPGFRECDTNGNNCYDGILQNCVYIDDKQDELGVPYIQEMTNNDVINAMGDAYICWQKFFTPGQVIRIREVIDWDPLNAFAAAETTISALYEPYKGDYYFAGPQPPGYVTPKFQPGFEYRFIECSGYYPQPAPYNEPFTSNPFNIVKYIAPNETSYPDIYHPNHSAITIQEVDIANDYSQVQKCYNNYNQNPIGGTLVHFNDDIFNNNVTITPQDSTSINNPQFINNLDPGLYNVIEEYNNGQTEETVVFKEND